MSKFDEFVEHARKVAKSSGPENRIYTEYEKANIIAAEAKLEIVMKKFEEDNESFSTMGLRLSHAATLTIIDQLSTAVAEVVKCRM